jgi:dihydroorotase-like cyclic amidohydrolase
MPSLYIVLEKKIPSADVYVNGSFLSKHNDELGRMAKRLGVQPLMDFFSISKEELLSLAEDYGASLNKPKAAHQEKWFTAEEGLRTINALLQGLASSKLGQSDRIEAELREFVKVLELAKANGVRWHLGVDY